MRDAKGNLVECPWCAAHPHQQPCCAECKAAREGKELLEKAIQEQEKQ